LIKISFDRYIAFTVIGIFFSGREKMSDLEVRFKDAHSNTVRECPDDTTLLRQYALFKQATAGDITGGRPGISDMEGRARYDAWAELKGTTRTEAMNQYIDLIESLKVDLSTYIRRTQCLSLRPTSEGPR
jgi:acyl-CoA-binding protein